MHHAESNGEEVVGTQQRGKVKPQHGPKKSKRSLRRRVQYILASPVHLFRRYVLRKRPKKLPTRTEDNDDAESIAFPESVEIARERKVPCYLLFLGLQNSGKSTTISKLFNGKRPTCNADKAVIKVFKNATVGHNIGLKVVDTPGFSGSEQHDTRIVAALSSFLKQDLPHRIPTVTFIVARLDDDDGGSLEETDDSHFTRMLKVLSRAENLITDQLYSNIVLLLTHSQKANNVSSRILKYQTEFSRMFNVKNLIPVIAIDNIRYNSKLDEKLQTYHDIIFKGLKEFSERRQEHCLNALMHWFTAKAKRFSIPLEEETILVDGLSDISLPNSLKVSESYEPYFVMHHTDGKKRRKTQRSNNESTSSKEVQKQLQTCIASGSQIALADNSLISIDKCLVGDKLLGLHSATSVIIGIRKSTIDEVRSEGKSVGSIYCCMKLDHVSNDKDATGGKSIFMYNNDAFELVDASKANVPEQLASAHVYFLELDSPTGTFIMNGFPCFAAVVCDAASE